MGALRARDQTIDVPQPRRPRIHRPHPRIRAIGAREQRRRLQCATALRDDERGWRRTVVLARLAELGRNRRVGERRRRCPGGSRRRAVASAASRCRPGRVAGRARSARLPRPRSRSTSQRSVVHVRGSRPERRITCSGTPVDRRDPDELVRRRCSRGTGRAASARRARFRRTRRRPRGRARRGVRSDRRGCRTTRPAPSAPRSGSARSPERHRAIRRDGHARENAGEHGRRHREPEDGDERAAVTPAKTLPRKPGNKRDRSQCAAFDASGRRPSSSGSRRSTSSTTSTKRFAMRRRTATRSAGPGTT